MHITRQVFRDMGIAFLVAVFGIYILLLYQTQSDLPRTEPIVNVFRRHVSILGICYTHVNSV